MELLVLEEEKSIKKEYPKTDAFFAEVQENGMEKEELDGAVVLSFGDLLDFQDDEVLLLLSSLNPNLRFETDKNNQLIIKMATKLTTGNQNAELIVELGIWNRIKKLGQIFESNAGFRMPITGSIKSPDVAFVLNSKLEQLNEKDAEGFAKIAPEFVIELRSDSDALKPLIDKMLEYIENGVRLGWLIDPKGEKVYIYRLNGNHTSQTFDEKLSGEDVLPDFTLEIRELFKKK
jgi:Uma2 family endonuclease